MKLKKIKKKIRFLIWMMGIRNSIKPPNELKERTIKFYQKVSRIKTLIETGTYEGEMIDALKNKFKYIFSIELNKELAEKAKKKFKGFKEIKIIQGDSGKELPKILEKIDEPCIFWLDAHIVVGRLQKVKEKLLF